MDISYKVKSIWIQITPETRDGETLYNEFVKQNNGSDAILAIHLPMFKAMVKKAGYSIRKATPKKVKESDAELLAAIGI